MEQNSIKIFKILSVVFVILFIISFILFFIPKAGLINTIDYNEALQKAKEQNKGLILIPYSRWDKKMKLNSQFIFSDRDIKNLLDTNLIPVIIDLASEKNKQIINDYGLSGNFSLLTNKYGSPVTFLFNTNTAMEFKILLNEALKLPFLKWDNYNTAQEKTNQTDKPTICFFTSTLNDNLRLAEYLKQSNNYDYLEMNFYPVLVFINYPANLELAKQILGFDDDLIKSAQKSENTNNMFRTMINNNIKATILGKDGSKLAQGTLNNEVISKGNLQEFIDDIFKNIGK